MAAMRATNRALTLARRFETRWMEDRQEATVQRPLQAVIRSECALTYEERRFPAKPDTTR